jgi:Ferritin-like domain
VHATANYFRSFDHKLPVDVDILNFALTLEHIENAFYNQGLSKFKQEDFVNAGFPDWTYGRLKQIASHEAAHTEFLEKILGDKATKPCSYKLSVILGGSDFARRWLTAYPYSPYDDPKSFVTLSHALEVIGKCLTVVVCPSISFYYNTRGFIIHWGIEVLRQQGTLPSILPQLPVQR